MGTTTRVLGASVSLLLAAGGARAFTIEDAQLRVQGGTTMLEGRIAGAAPGPVLLSVQYGVAPVRRGNASSAGMPDPGWMGPGAAPGSMEPAPSNGSDPVEVRLDGVDRAELKRDFDSRMVEQRQLPPYLSVPFSLDLWKGSTWIRLRYNSFRESFGPGDTEDAFSAPVVAILASRNGLALAQTPLGNLVTELLARQEPLARTGDMRLGELKVKVEGQPVRGVKIEGGSSPRAVLRSQPGKLEFEVRVVRDTRLAYVDRLQDGSLEPIGNQWVTVETGPLSTRLGETQTGADGWARLGLTPVAAQRISLYYHPQQGQTWGGGNLSLYWRWGRPEEAWLDAGAPVISKPDPAVVGDARLRAVVESILRCWSPDEGTFKDPGGATGFCSDHQVVEAMGPVLARLGAGLAEPAGAVAGSLAGLRARLAWAEEGVAKYDLHEPITSELGSLPGTVPSARFAPLLTWLGFEAEEHAGHFTRKMAWAAVVAGRWAAGPAAGSDPKGRAQALGLVRRLRDLADVDPLPYANSWTGKTAEPTLVAEPGDWLAALMLADAFAWGAKAGGGYEGQQKAQQKRLLKVFPAAELANLPLAHLALGTKLLREMVELHGQKVFAPALAKLEALVATAWVEHGQAMDSCDRLSVLKGLGPVR